MADSRTWRLWCLARGADDDAMAAFERELSLEDRGHLYAREIAANTWYAIGACRWRQGNHDAARAGFKAALARLPQHPLATAGLALASNPRARDSPVNGHAVAPAAAPLELTLADAALRVSNDDLPGAAGLVGAALADAPPGNAGWTIPIEPLLGVSRAPDAWGSVLGRVRVRAG